MRDETRPFCPECADEVDQQPLLHRRGFIRAAGEGTAGLLALGTVAAVPAMAETTPAKVEKPAKPAEALVKELFAGLTPDQKKTIILPWDHGSTNGKSLPTRMGMYNDAIGGKHIGDHYTKAQQELILKILRAISSDDDGFRCITRGGTFDGSHSLQGCGCTLFGDPAGGGKYAWVFTGHHLTVRCDGDSEEGAAFGGPVYYGHSPNGYSPRNIFNYQTKRVLSVFDALSEKQRKVAVITGTPGEQYPSVQFRAKDKPKPGLSFGEMNKSQRALVEKVMRDILSPYRKEDVDEVMKIIKTNGGMERIHLAFYQDGQMNDSQPWHFWRLEGPGFVWNYRVLPHVHTYVNISSKV
jgi:hypothetical protein